MPETKLNDDDWREVYGPKCGDSFRHNGVVWMRYLCGGCALSKDPRPIWVVKGTPAPLCPRCAKLKREAQEEALASLMRPNPGLKRGRICDAQYEGPRGELFSRN